MDKTLETTDKVVFNDIKASVIRKIQDANVADDSTVKNIITEEVFLRSENKYICLKDKHRLSQDVFNSIRRLGILQPLIEDDSITEIMINGPFKIFIEKEGHIEKLDSGFESLQQLEDVIQVIVSNANRTVNEYSPIVDARLADGSRINVVLKPVALNGPVMTIRKFGSRPLGIRELIGKGALTEEASGELKKFVEAKFNIFICGGTGSGKTTFLNALSHFIPRHERIITIEDSAELKLPERDNLVSLETRNANTEGKGKIEIRELIKASLRMRPERIIVGEVRGAEALDMLQAMNTGHDGSLSTGHGNSARDMLSRLETMVLMASGLPLEAIRQQIASAIDILVFLSRMSDKSRKVIEITELAGYEKGDYIMNPLYCYEECSTGQNMLIRTKNSIMKKYRLKNIRRKA